MLRLQTLGGLFIEGDVASPPSPGLRRRQLALLALVACHDPIGISRDKLLAYLWPESDTRRARNSLKQALSSIRQLLGSPVVISIGGMVRLDPSLIEVDLWEVEAALAQGDVAGAISVYTGPFLDGFSLRGREEFEHWKEAVRDRLARQYSGALRELAARADEEGNRLRAVTRGPELRAVAAAPAKPAPPSLPANRHWARWVVAAFWAVVLLVVLPRSWAVRSPHAATALEPMTVAVAPFVVTGELTSGQLGRSLTAVLAARLDGADGLRTAVSRGSATSLGGARLEVRGRLFVAGGRLRALAILYDRGNANAAIAHAEAEVESNEVFDLADALASQLIADRFRGPHQRLTWAALTSTRSLPALKAYLLGERRFQADSYPAAIDAFRQAVAADTAFALAYYRLSLAADWDKRSATASWAADLAARFGDRLSDHDNRLVQAYVMQRQGRMDEAAQLYQEIVDDYPQDTEAWLQLGEVLLRDGRFQGWSAEEAGSAFKRVLALDPENRDALLHLARLSLPPRW